MFVIIPNGLPDFLKSDPQPNQTNEKLIDLVEKPWELPHPKVEPVETAEQVGKLPSLPREKSQTSPGFGFGAIWQVGHPFVFFQRKAKRFLGSYRSLGKKGLYLHKM